jgi:hypothetical protein
MMDKDSKWGFDNGLNSKKSFLGLRIATLIKIFEKQVFF